MQVKNVNDMKYAMRRAQRDVSCVGRESFEYINGDDSFIFYIDYHWNHCISDDGYIATWSFIKNGSMKPTDLIVELSENREQSFDDVAKIALDHIVEIAQATGYECEYERKYISAKKTIDRIHNSVASLLLHPDPSRGIMLCELIRILKMTEE